MKVAAILFCILLSACTSIPKQVVMTDATVVERNKYLAMHATWAFNGRLAYSHFGQGGSVKAKWQKSATSTEVNLSTALNLGSVVFTEKNGVAQIKTSDGGLKQGSPEDLMYDLLKTPLPYSTIAIGLRADWSGIPDAVITWQDGLPLQVDAKGWTWRYQDWTTSPAVLPRKIELSQDQTRVRIVIDQWLEVQDE